MEFKEVQQFNNFYFHFRFLSYAVWEIYSKWIRFFIGIVLFCCKCWSTVRAVCWCGSLPLLVCTILFCSSPGPCFVIYPASVLTKPYTFPVPLSLRAWAPIVPHLQLGWHKILCYSSWNKASQINCQIHWIHCPSAKEFLTVYFPVTSKRTKCSSPEHRSLYLPIKHKIEISPRIFKRNSKEVSA